MKTIRQIADEINVSKQKVYRFVKKECISEAHQKNKVMYYDEAVEMLIKSNFIGESHQECINDAHQNHINDARNDAHQNHINDARNDVLYDILKDEIEFKNELIYNLQNELEKERQYSREQAEKLAIITDQAQKLQLAQMTSQTLEDDLIEPKVNTKKSLWSKIFYK